MVWPSRRGRLGRFGSLLALNRERAVSWSRTPVGRRAGLQRARGRGSQASGAFATDQEVEGGEGAGRQDHSARSLHALCRGEGNQQLGAALASVVGAASLPALSTAGYLLMVPFYKLGNRDPEKGGDLLRVPVQV